MSKIDLVVFQEHKVTKAMKKALTQDEFLAWELESLNSPTSLMDEQYLDICLEEKETPDEVLLGSFLWRESSMGYAYWEAIRKRLNKEK